MDFILTETEFNKENIAWNGNRFLIGNGYFGIRGTLEEYTKKADVRRKYGRHLRPRERLVARVRKCAQSHIYICKSQW